MSPHCQTWFRVLNLTLALLAFGLTTACARLASSASVTSSVSLASSASSSEIISSPFRSSSRSPCCQEEQKIEEETEGYTTAYLLVGPGDAESFLRGLAEIAARHGFSDWQRYSYSWTGVARGLAAAGLSEAESLQYAQYWANGDPVLVSLVKQTARAEIHSSK